MHCPCNSSFNYQDCCEPLHNGVVADSPERLMRSRYSAFALNLPLYLEQTWHSSTRQSVELSDNPEWVQLQIIKSNQNGNEGMVHFRAFYKLENEIGMMEEKSNFVREQGQWFYIQGEVLA